MKQSKLKKSAVIAVVLLLLALCLACVVFFKAMKNSREQYENVVEKYVSEKKELADAEALLEQQQASIGQLEEEMRVLQEKIAIYEDPGNGIKAHGALRVDGIQLCNERGEPIQLHGFSTHGIGWYPRYTNSAAIRTIKEYGANVVRMAMYTDENQGYVYDSEKILNYLYVGVENALAEDMYVIVDWHILSDNNPLQYKEEAKQFFAEISSHYGNHPGIIYEICNEPNSGTSWDDITAYANEIIPVIRANAPDAVILVGTPEYCTQVEEAAANPLDYENIMYVFHAYVDVTTADYSAISWVEDKLDCGIPIFVSEWGITDEKDTQAEKKPDNAYAFMKMMEERNLSWCNWSLSNKAEIYSAIKPECDKYSGWTEDDFTFSGKIALEGLAW